MIIFFSTVIIKTIITKILIRALAAVAAAATVLAKLQQLLCTKERVSSWILRERERVMMMMILYYSRIQI